MNITDARNENTRLPAFFPPDFIRSESAIEMHVNIPALVIAGTAFQFNTESDISASTANGNKNANPFKTDLIITENP